MSNKRFYLFVLVSLIATLTVACAKETVIISDMSRCKPGSALSKEKKKNSWTLSSYKSDEINGVMLGAGSRAEAPDVTLPLDVSGWYAIHLGFWNPAYAYDGDTIVKLKLTDDPCFRVIRDPATTSGWEKSVLQECFVKYADLTGQDMVIGQQSKGEAKHAYVAYIKLVPLSDEEVDSIKKDRARKDTKVIFAANDGISFLLEKGCTTKEEIIEQVEPYRYSDVGRVLWAFTYGDITNYPTKVGTFLSSWASTHAFTGSPGYEKMCRGLDAVTSQGIIPAQVALDYIHDMDLEFHAMIRMAILGDTAPSDYMGSPFLARRPHLRMLAKDGTPLDKASYAFPEVQDHMLAIIREIAENYDIDGINLAFIRGPMFIGYEAPVVADFQKKYGEDPREIDENDPRVQQLRADYLTEFVRKARKLVDEVGKKKGKKLELSAWLSSHGQNLFFGEDMDAFLEERLFDSILGYGPKEFVQKVQEAGCKFYSWGGNMASPTEGNYTGMILTGYGNGADGFSAWDLNLNSQDFPETWSVVSRSGHEEEVRALHNKEPLKTRIKTISLKSISGADISHTTNNGSRERGFWPPEQLPLYSGG